MSARGSSPHAVVIGAGFTGLSAGWELARAGWRVTVLEADEDVGGLAGDFAVGTARLEKFYHHWFRSDREIQGLIEELGAADRVVWRESRTGLYHNRGILRLSTPLDVLRFTPLPFLDRLRLGRLALAARRIESWRELDGLRAAEWLRDVAGERAYRVVWEPLLRGKFGPHADDVSAVWIWNKLKLRGGSRGRGGAEQLGYYRGGFTALARLLAERIEQHGGRVLPSCPVERVRVDDTGRAVGVACTGRETIDADVVLATPALPIVAGLVREVADPAWVASLGSIEYLANVCLVLELDRSLSSTYWLNVADPSFPFVGVIEHTNFEPSASYDGRHVVYLSRYLPASDPAWTRSVSDLAIEAVPHLRRMFPSFDPAWILRVHGWKARWAQPIVVRGYADRIPSHATPIPGLYLASMAQIYPEDRGTNYAVRDGRAVARRIDEDQRAARRPGDTRYTTHGRFPPIVASTR